MENLLKKKEESKGETDTQSKLSKLSGLSALLSGKKDESGDQPDIAKLLGEKMQSAFK